MTFSIAGEGKRWPVPAAVEITDGNTTWQWGLAQNQTRKKQIVRLLPGDYRLAVSAPGHRSLEQTVKVTATGRRLDLGVLAMQASRTASGTVISPERLPVAGCAVLADGVTLGFTDARGRFDAELPVPPPQFAILSHPQFAPRTLPIVADGDSAFGTIQLARGGSIAITVDRQNIGDEMKIAASVYQFVGDGRSRRRAEASLAAKETRLTFTNLDPGDYGVVLAGPGPTEQAVMTVTVADGVVSEAGITIAPFRLHLSVLYGDEGLGNATVRLLNSGGLQRRLWKPEIVLDAEGTATIDLWQRGLIYAEVRSEQLANAFAPPPLDASVEESEMQWDIVVPLQRVDGVVYDAATGDPVKGARVIHESEDASGATRMTDDAGRFAFEALPEGRHTFRVDSSRHLPSEPVSVTFVGPGAERHLEFRLKKGKTIPIEVRDAEGRAIPAAIVIDGCTSASRPRGFRTDERGILDLPSPNGRHKLCVVPMQGSFALLDVEQADATSQPVQVRVPAPSVNMRVVAKTPDGVPVAQLGLLLVHNGRVVPITVVRTLAELQRRPDRTDDRGELLLAGMPAGHYEFFVYATDEEAAALEADRRKAAPIYSGYLAPGDATLDVVIEPR